MRITALWRYPVKSLQGQRVTQVEVTPTGMVSDRRWAIFDRETGFGLTGRRMPALLLAAAQVDAEGQVRITLPDGSVATDDAALSAWLGRPVQLRSADEDLPRAYENPVDAEHEDSSEWETWSGAAASFHDSSRTAVSLVSGTTLAGWAPRRFRSNVQVDGAGEDALVGRTVAVGDAVLDVRKRIDRCVMVTRPQPAGDGGPLERDLDVLRTIHRTRDGCLGIGATIVRPGTIAVGDELTSA